MTTDWMVDLLADMEKFAELNGMNELRKQLAECRELAVEAQCGQKTSSNQQRPK